MRCCRTEFQPVFNAYPVCPRWRSRGATNPIRSGNPDIEQFSKVIEGFQIRLWREAPRPDMT